MGLCSWYTRRNGSSYMGRMRFPIRTTIYRRFLQSRIIYFKRNHLGIFPPLFPRCIRFSAPSKERMPRHSPNHYNLQRHLLVHPHTPLEAANMGLVPHPRVFGIHSNHFRLQSTLSTTRLGMGFRFLWTGNFCELLGI